MSIEIRDVRAICTAPEGINLVAVKIETNEPELYGVGCATFAHRYSAVVTVMDGFSPDFFLYWNLILSHLCTGYHGRRLRIPLNMSITLFLDINVPSTVYHLHG